MGRPHNFSIEAIVDELQSLPQSADERGHQEADQLLIRALYALQTNSDTNLEQIQELVDAYEAISKWYA